MDHDGRVELCPITESWFNPVNHGGSMGARCDMISLVQSVMGSAAGGGIMAKSCLFIHQVSHFLIRKHRRTSVLL